MGMEIVESLPVRYRPKRLEEVIGQEDIVHSIRGMFRTRKINPSYLIVGPSGCGKTSLARIIAHYINCQNFDFEKVAPCGSCAYCTQVSQGNYPGVQELNFGNERGIDTVRAVIESLQYESLYNASVYILDEAHKMTKDAQEAFLKPLEEPPSGVIFILLTTEVKKIVPTIRNRCNRLNLSPVHEETLAAFLGKVGEGEQGPQLPREMYHNIALLSKGHVRQALQSLETVMQYALGDPKFDPNNMEVLTSLIGKVLEQDDVSYGKFLVSGLYCGDIGLALSQVPDLVASSDPRRTFEALLSYHIQILNFMVDPQQKYGRIHDPYYSHFRKWLVDETKKDIGRMKLTAEGAMRIAELFIDLVEKAQTYEYTALPLLQAYTVKMYQAVIDNCGGAYSTQSDFHIAHAPHLLCGN